MRFTGMLVLGCVLCHAPGTWAWGMREEQVNKVALAPGESAASPIIIPRVGGFSLSMGSGSAKTDLESLGLKGAVLSVEDVIAVFTEGPGGKLTSQTATSRYVHTFDRKGKLTEIVDEPSVQGVGNRVVFTYDARDNNTEISVYSLEGSLLWKFLSQYDSNGSLIESTRISPDGTQSDKVTYQYEAKTNQVEMTSYNPDGSVGEKWVHTYDEKGRRTNAAQQRFDRLPYTKITYSYDDKGKTVESTQYDLKDRPFERFVTVYDKDGNALEESSYKDGALVSKATILRNFDKNGNWVLAIRQSYSIKKGTTVYEPPQITVRTIEYDE